MHALASINRNSYHFFSITENKPHSNIGCCLAGRTIVVRDYPLAFTQLTWQTR